MHKIYFRFIAKPKVIMISNNIGNKRRLIENLIIKNVLHFQQVWFSRKLCNAMYYQRKSSQYFKSRCFHVFANYLSTCWITEGNVTKINTQITLRFIQVFVEFLHTHHTCIFHACSKHATWLVQFIFQILCMLTLMTLGSILSTYSNPLIYYQYIEC